MRADIRQLTAPSAPQSDAQVIRDDIYSKDDGRIAESIAMIEAKEPRIIRKDLAARYHHPLLDAKQFDEIEKLALIGMLDGPEDTKGVAEVQRCRVEALLAAGKDDAALTQAKVYFNFCPLDQTAAALDQFVTALAKARGNSDEKIVRRFKLQQAVWAETQQAADSRQQAENAGQATGASSTQPPQPAAGDLGENILLSIKVNSFPFDARIRQVEGATLDFVNLTALGNLYLLADRPAGARKAFEKAVELANSKTLPDAVSNVARAVRAESGAIGPANDYILALRSGS